MPSPSSTATGRPLLVRRILLVAVPLLVIALLAVWLWPTPALPPSAPATASTSGPLVLTAEQIAAQGIASQPVAAAETYPLPGLAAEASTPLDASARVVVPYAGVVTRLLVDEGAMVERG